jgi:hypothetical protein
MFHVLGTLLSQKETPGTHQIGRVSPDGENKDPCTPENLTPGILAYEFNFIP